MPRAFRKAAPTQRGRLAPARRPGGQSIHGGSAIVQRRTSRPRTQRADGGQAECADRRWSSDRVRAGRASRPRKETRRLSPVFHAHDRHAAEVSASGEWRGVKCGPTIACTSGGSNDHSVPAERQRSAGKRKTISPAEVMEMSGGEAPLRCASVMPSGNVSASKMAMRRLTTSRRARTMFRFRRRVRTQTRGVNRR